MTHTETKQVDACPECDSTQIERRVGDPRAPGGRGEAPPRLPKWGCGVCGAAFDTPVTRPSRRTPGGGLNHGLAKRLADADPDEVVRP